MVDVAKSLCLDISVVQIWRIYFNQHMRMTSTICYKGPKMKQAWTNGQSFSPATEGSITVQTPTYPILNLIDFIPKDGCKRGPRGARKRQTFPSRGARARRAFPLDKWRNLLKACGIDFTSTAKGNAQKTMLWPLDKRLIEQITQLAYKHPYPRQKY
uniref:Uncharacterized protein n=1 Tax=Oryza meridionalis TaxID=40149 RepID=A0A0E0EYD7_9ORYZ